MELCTTVSPQPRQFLTSGIDARVPFVALLFQIRPPFVALLSQVRPPLVALLSQVRPPSVVALPPAHRLFVFLLFAACRPFVIAGVLLQFFRQPHLHLGRTMCLLVPRFFDTGTIWCKHYGKLGFGFGTRLSLHAFVSNIESSASRYRPLKIEGGTYWEAEVEFDDSDNIPSQLSDHLNRCSFYEDKVRRHRHAFPVSEENQNLFLQHQLGLCASLGNITDHLPSYYRHASTFSDSLIYELNVTQTYMENSVNDTSRVAVVEQQRINQKIPEIAATWQKRYQRFKGPGIYMQQEIKLATNSANSYMELIQHAKVECVKARIAKKKQWPIGRRIGRGIGLFRVPAEDLYELDDACRELDPLFNEVGGLHRIFSLAGSNVTQVNTALGNLAENKLNADIRFQVGPDGREKLQDYLDGFQLEAQGVRRTIGDARMIKRVQGAEEAVVKPAVGKDGVEETKSKE
ncbi:MAG: hypothetical protein Q9221_000356 [Calogaya cf. arnoldii]